jgi:hypothetical protein
MGTAGLLASVMFHISSTSSLPTVSYLTRVDKYMLAIYSTLLVHIVLAVYSLTLEEEVGEDPVKIEHLKKVYKMIATYVPVYAAFLLSIVLFHIV